MNLISYFNESLDYENYIQLLGENLSLHKLHYRNFELINQDLQILEKMPTMNILVISEPWCGDSFALLPIVKKISEANKTWKLKVILRDKNLDLIDNYLTKGGRAIPIFLFLDNNFEFKFKWGPRPQATQNIFEKYRTQINRGDVDKAKILLKIRQYYSKDKGKETSQEILNLIYKHTK